MSNSSKRNRDEESGGSAKRSATSSFIAEEDLTDGYIESDDDDRRESPAFLVEDPKKSNKKLGKGDAELLREKENNVKIIGFWNFKGGVGKTTSCFAAGYEAAMSGKKVLLVDTDPQKNLTQTICRYFEGRNVSNHGLNIKNIKDEVNYGFYKSVVSCMDSYQIIPAKICNVPIEDVGSVEEQFDADNSTKGNIISDSLFLLPGSFSSILLDNKLTQGYNLNGNSALKETIGMYPSIIRNMLRRTASAHDIEYVFVDLSPSIGILNTTILFTCDSFVLPIQPDQYCIDALTSIPKLLNPSEKASHFKIFKDWKRSIHEWVDELDTTHIAAQVIRSGYFELLPLEHCVQFAGMFVSSCPYINTQGEGVSCSKAFTYNKTSTVILSQLESSARKLVIDPIEGLPAEMVVKIRRKAIENILLGSGEYIPEFHKLSSISTFQSIPVSFLPNRLLNRHFTGRKVIDQAKVRRRHAREVMGNIVHGLLELTDMPMDA